VREVLFPGHLAVAAGAGRHPADTEVLLEAPLAFRRGDVRSRHAQPDSTRTAGTSEERIRAVIRFVTFETLEVQFSYLPDLIRLLYYKMP